MRKVIIYSIILAIVSIIIYSGTISYFTKNIDLGQSGFFPEAIPTEYYANNLIGVSGVVRNDTILPMRIESITPIGGNGVKYFTSVASTWGVSQTTREEISKLEPLEGKRISPFSQQDIGIIYQFSEEYAVNPAGYEITYTILGIKFSQIIIYNR